MIRFLRVGRIYLLMASPLTISLYITFGEDLISEHGISSLWAFYGIAYVILISTRIISNPNRHIIDKGWEFHKLGIKREDKEFKDDLDIKRNYVLYTLKPRIQGIVLSISFIILVYILMKALILILTFGTFKFPFNKITSDDIQSIVFMTLGVIPAVFISEVVLKVLPPLVKE